MKSGCLTFCATSIGLLAINLQVQAAELDKVQVNKFITYMVERHAYNVQQLNYIFADAEYLDEVLKAISRPAESKPWFEYQEIFLTRQRVEAGARFWTENAEALLQASKRYGVPPEVIVAIIGIETFYGRNTGIYRMIDSLATLAFNYPRRASFFRRELEQFLLLTREEGIEPLELKGSYAGATGLPQFISSSFRRYAVDFNGDGQRDIWEGSSDAIGSVGNYLREHGWRRGEPMVTAAQLSSNQLGDLLSDKLKPPQRQLAEFMTRGVMPQQSLPMEKMAILMKFEGRNRPEFWLGFENFYVLTRYNQSSKYALAVAQLSEAIREARIGATGLEPNS